MAKPFASSADLGEKKRTLELLADGVYALTAEGDPNIGAIEGEDFVVCFEALATPVAAQEWIDLLRQHTDKPITHLILSHYHAVRVLGASAYGAQHVIAHESTKRLIDERGQADWDSEFGRMPRLFKDPESIPGSPIPHRRLRTGTSSRSAATAATSSSPTTGAVTRPATSSRGSRSRGSSSPATSSRPRPRSTPATPSTGTGAARRSTPSPAIRPSSSSAVAAA